MFYKVCISDDNKSGLHVPLSFLSSNTIDNTKLCSLNAGLSKAAVEVIYDKEIKDNELYLSKNIIELLSIPSGIEYQVCCNGNDIRLGPVIGLLMAVSKRALTKGRLNKLLSYTNIYPEIKGLLFAFSAAEI